MAKSKPKRYRVIIAEFGTIWRAKVFTAVSLADAKEQAEAVEDYGDWPIINSDAQWEIEEVEEVE